MARIDCGCCGHVPGPILNAYGERVCGLCWEAGCRPSIDKHCRSIDDTPRGDR